MLDEEKPLSFVLNELGLTLRQWEEIVENDQPLRDVLDLVRLWIEIESVYVAHIQKYGQALIERLVNANMRRAQL